MTLNEKLKQALHNHYLTMREFYDIGIKFSSIQRSFENLLNLDSKNSWRPTHISLNAAKEIISGNTRNIQRAHGIVPDRLDRINRAKVLFSGPIQKFDEWYKFYCYHDKTILITKLEHNENIKFDYENLIKLPDWNRNMFQCGSFSVNIRKKTEIKWLKENINDFKN